MIADGIKPEKIVAIVGAFHAPVVSGEFPAMTDDELKRLPRRSSKLTLMPYSYFKLSTQSGYGAGNRAPAYFELLWEALEAGGYPRVAGSLSLAWSPDMMREAGTHRSSAEVIEARPPGADTVGPEGRLRAHARATCATRRSRSSVTASAPRSRRRSPTSTSARRSANSRKGVSRTSIQEDFDRTWTS